MICNLGTDMEKGSALCFECHDNLVDAFKNGAVLKTCMVDSDDKDWEEKWQMQGTAFLSDTEMILPDLEKLVQRLDLYSYEIEVYLDGKLIGFVSGV